MTVTFVYFICVSSLCVCTRHAKKRKHATQNTVSKNIERRQESEKHLVFLPKINHGSESRRKSQLKFPPYDFFKTFRIMFLDPSGTLPCIAYRKMYRTVEVELILYFLRKSACPTVRRLGQAR
jgi:hypothetical protein